MVRAVLIVVLALTAIQCYGAVQVQMPVASELQMEDESNLQAQIKDLQRNVSDIWTYIYELRSAVSQHLTHLRQHQIEIESSMHRMEHYHEDSHSHGNLHSDSHHHGGDEQHSHSGEQHSHGGDHGSDHHSHSGEHHSHSGEHHSHSGEHHSSHSGEHHSHSDDHHSSHSGEHGHHSHSYSHSHSHGGHDHSKESGHSHTQGESDHKDSHETEDLTQTISQTVQKESPPVAEPVVVATNRREPYHHHHHHHHHGSESGSTSGLNLMGEHGFHSHHHHHHQDSTTTTTTSIRNRTVELPRYSDYDQYDYALCSVQPNRAIPEEKQQNVGGTVALWQKKSGGPLNFHVRLQGFSMGNHHDHHQAHQDIQQEENNETPQEVGHRHGFHIHDSGDLSNGCQSTGGHYNPKGVNHGGPNSLSRHVGDLGNIECDNNGVTNILFSDDIASLKGQYSVVGRAIVIHSDPDDFGLGGNEESLKTGNAGTRIACCVIQKVDKFPMRYYKAMKSATQYKTS